VCLTIVLALRPAAGSDWQLADLMQTLSHNQQQKATFVEKHYLSVLDKPLDPARLRRILARVCAGQESDG